MSDSIQTDEVGQKLQWTSPLTFFLASTGMAVGLGNMWRFPFLAGENGGGAFVLVYLAAVAAIGFPIMTAELLIGRRGGAASDGAVRALIASEGASRFWRAIGYLCFAVPLVGVGYYGVIAGWVLDYAVVYTASGGFAPESDHAARFDLLLADPTRLILAHTVFIVACAAVVSRGLKRGIERLSRLMMPALFVILAGLVVYAAFHGQFGRAFAFLFRPNFQELTPTSVLLAVGQAFFSLSVGFGALMTFGAYLPKGISLPRTAASVCAADTLVALLAGLAIFPIVFAAGLDAGGGPGLVFITLPTVFGQVPGGYFIGAAFFVLFFFAAFTTGVATFEAVAGWLGTRGIGRKAALIWSGCVAWTIGAVATLSFNVLADAKPPESLPIYGGKTLFDALDFTVANVMLPLNGLLIALFAGWALKPATTADELGGDSRVFRTWRFLVRFLVPLAVVAIVLTA